MAQHLTSVGHGTTALRSNQGIFKAIAQ